MRWIESSPAPPAVPARVTERGSVTAGGGSPPSAGSRAGSTIPKQYHLCYPPYMATDDEPLRDPADDKLAENLRERIRSGTVPPGDDKLTESIRPGSSTWFPSWSRRRSRPAWARCSQTEEGIRRLASENLPDVVGYVASSTNDAKDKVWEIIARETRDFLSNLNLTEEIAKILTTLSFEIKTEVRFIPNSERLTGAEPDVKASVRLKRNDRGDKPDKADRADRADPGRADDDRK